MPRASIYWTHFTKTGKTATCNRCLKEGIAVTNGSTTGIKNHLEKYHPDSYLKTLKDNIEKKRKADETLEVLAEAEAVSKKQKMSNGAAKLFKTTQKYGLQEPK